MKEDRCHLCKILSALRHVQLLGVDVVVVLLSHLVTWRECYFVSNLYFGRVYTSMEQNARNPAQFRGIVILFPGRCVVSSIPTALNQINDVVEQPAGMLCFGLSHGYNLRIPSCVRFVLNVGRRARSWVYFEGRAAGDGSEEQSSSFEIRQHSSGCGGSDSVYAPNAIPCHSRHRQVKNSFV